MLEGVLSCKATTFGDEDKSQTHGIPESVRSDNGPLFSATEFEGFLNYLGIAHLKGIPYWPQSNGEGERCNETALKVINSYSSSTRLI